MQEVMKTMGKLTREEAITLAGLIPGMALARLYFPDADVTVKQPNSRPLSQETVRAMGHAAAHLQKAARAAIDRQEKEAREEARRALQAECFERRICNSLGMP